MDLTSITRNPIPGGVSANLFSASDGAELRFALWPPTARGRQGTVCVFPGRGEYIEKYFEVVADLRRRGFHVAMMDWRGQGGSGRSLKNARKGHIRSFRQYDSDLADFMAKIVLPDSPPPYFALAHSMGGHIMLRHARMKNSWFERMLLVAPMIRFAPDTLPVLPSLVSLFSYLAIALGMGRSFIPGGSEESSESDDFEGNPLTSDRSRFDRNAAILEANPSLAIGSPTYGWVSAACCSMAELRAPDYPSSVSVPLFMIAAGNDSVVSTQAIENLAGRLKLGAAIIIPNARHEILQECDEVRQQFWAAFDAYIPGSKSWSS